MSTPLDVDTDNIIGPVLSFLENTLASNFFIKLLISNLSYISVYKKRVNILIFKNSFYHCIWKYYSDL